MIEPVLVDRSYTITVRRVDEDTQLLVLQSSPPTSLEACLDSLRTVLQAIHTSIASEEASLETRQLLLSYLVPQVQQLLVTHLLVFLMPQNADRGALTTFQETCKLVADFEARELLSTNFTFEPKLQEWVEQAGQHWANALIQRSFATLRADVITSEYWNKTEKVDWLDDPNDVADKERWEKWLSNSSNADVTVEQQQGPEASTSRLPALIGHSSQAKIPDPASPEAEEDVAWEFEEEEQADDTIPASDSAPQSLPSAGVEDSPDLDADDAWGFDDDAHDAEAPELQSTERGINPATISKHGHKKNTLSHSSTRSRGSQKGTLSIKGQNNQHISLTGEIVEDDDDGGWSFDADADIDAEVEADKPLPIEELTPAEDSPVPVPNESGHSRQSSIEDAWGWSRNPDPDEDKPIGKPTKVIVSKKLGAKGRTGSPASPTPFSTDIESDTSRTSTPVMQQVSVNDAVDTMSSKQVEPGQSSAALAIDSVPQKPKQELTSLLISSSAKRVAETSMELLEAALAVSSSS